jgi:cytochrome c oxidase subunit 4
LAQHSASLPGAHDAHDAPDAHDAHAGHPNEWAYIKIALILAVITGVEVLIYYIDAVGDFLVPALFILSAVKFVTVVAYFMHLKFDDRRLAWIFTGGFFLAVATFVGLGVLHYFHEVTQFVSDKIL